MSASLTAPASRSPTPPRASERTFAAYTIKSVAPTRLASLDGLRAVSLAIVMLNHAKSTRGFPPFVRGIVSNPVVGLSELGLRMFFVISGFLITSLLMRELEQTGSINWTRFALRRSARIFPAYFSFVAIVSCLALAGVLAVDLSSILHALTFTVYFKGDRSWDVGHLWSMSMQEQFYLIWPLFFIFAGRKGARRFATVVALVFFTARLAVATFEPKAFSVFEYNVSFDTLALGCLFALYRDRLASMPLFKRLVESPFWIGAVFLAGNVVGLLGYRPALLLRLPLVSLAVVLTVERYMRHPHGRIGRILNHPRVVYIGSASFSLYIWQQLFLDHSASSFLTRFPVNVLVALPIGILSWHLIEQPAARALRKVFPKHLGESSRIRLSSTPVAHIPSAAWTLNGP